MGDQKDLKGESEPSAPRVLLVEDDFIIALDAADMLRELGVAQIWTAASKAEALQIMDTRDVQFVLLDVNLREEKGFEIAVRLRAAGIPFAFGTGYGDDRYAFPPEFAGAPIVSKPYRIERLAEVLAAHGIISAPTDITED